VVHVDVDVGHALRAVVEQPLDAHGDVVVDAEAARLAAHGVVQAAGEVHGVLGLALPDGATAVDRAGHDPGAGIVHVDEGRVVLGAEAVRVVGSGGVGRGGLDRGDVVVVVDGGQQLVGGHLGADHLDAVDVEDTEGVAEPGREVQASGRHRVRGAEVVPREGGVPDDPGLSWHD